MSDRITLPQFSDDNRGVSPVIGVILMVAITVILAAVVASFVLGFGDSISENVNAGADIEAIQGDADGEIRVTWISEGNAEELNVTVSGSGTSNLVDSDSQTLNNVGDTVTFEEQDGGDTEVRVTVIAEGPSGQETVISTETVTI